MEQNTYIHTHIHIHPHTQALAVRSYCYGAFNYTWVKQKQHLSFCAWTFKSWKWAKHLLLTHSQTNDIWWEKGIGILTLPAPCWADHRKHWCCPILGPCSEDLSPCLDQEKKDSCEGKRSNGARRKAAGGTQPAFSLHLTHFPSLLQTQSNMAFVPACPTIPSAAFFGAPSFSTSKKSWLPGSVASSSTAKDHR